MEARLGDVEKVVVRVETEVAHLKEDTEKILENQRNNQQGILDILHGTPEFAGLVTRLDRAERWQKAQAKILCLIGGALVPVIVAQVMDALKA